MFLKPSVFSFLPKPRLSETGETPIGNPEKVQNPAGNSVEFNYSKPGLSYKEEGDPVHYPGGFF